MAGKIDQRFEFLLTKQERSDLKMLAKRRGVSQGDILRGMIRRAAAKIR